MCERPLSFGIWFLFVVEGLEWFNWIVFPLVNVICLCQGMNANLHLITFFSRGCSYSNSTKQTLVIWIREEYIQVLVARWSQPNFGRTLIKIDRKRNKPISRKRVDLKKRTRFRSNVHTHQQKWCPNIIYRYHESIIHLLIASWPILANKVNVLLLAFGTIKFFLNAILRWWSIEWLGGKNKK